MINCIIDLETTGLPTQYEDPTKLNSFESARIIEFAAILYNTKTKQVIKKVNSFIKPNNFVIKNTDIHGITTEFATNNGKDITCIFTYLHKIIDRIDCITSFNIKFDLVVLLSELYRHDEIELYNKILKKQHICVMLSAMKLLNSRRYISLENTCKHLKLPYIKKHRALYDAELALNCMQLIGENNIVKYDCEFEKIDNKSYDIIEQLEELLSSEGVNYIEDGKVYKYQNGIHVQQDIEYISSGCVWCDGDSNNDEICDECLQKD